MDCRWRYGASPSTRVGQGMPSCLPGVRLDGRNQLRQDGLPKESSSVTAGLVPQGDSEKRLGNQVQAYLQGRKRGSQLVAYGGSRFSRRDESISQAS